MLFKILNVLGRRIPIGDHIGNTVQAAQMGKCPFVEFGFIKQHVNIFHILKEIIIQWKLCPVGDGVTVFQVSTVNGEKQLVKIQLPKILYDGFVQGFNMVASKMDIASKEILEEALVSYTGTVLYVSHDRYFINQTATRIMELTNQAVVNYIGDYDYYLEKKEELTSTYAPGSTSPEAPTEEKSISENKLSWQQMKEEQAKKRKREAELKKVEARIEELETRDSEIDETMVLPDVCTNVAECTKLSREKAAIAEELEELYEKWEELA